MEVIDTMNNGGFMASGTVTIYADFKILVVGYTSGSFFVYFSREAICISHEVARSKVSISPSMWIEEPPVSIVRWMVDDVIVFDLI